MSSRPNDTRHLQYRFEKEIEPAVNAFIDDFKQTSFVVGSYDLTAEPWRMASIIAFRKFNLKILEKRDGATGLTEITLVKARFSKANLG